VFLHQIASVEDIAPIRVDGKRCAFLYLQLSAQGQFQGVFDFSPNHGDFDENSPWTLGKALATNVSKMMEEMAASLQVRVATQLRELGLWAAPALMPYPLSLICHQLSEGKTDEARELLLQHCCSEFLAQRVANWATLPMLISRQAFFHSALAAHERGDFIASIHTLLPQVEGVVTSWVRTAAPTTKRDQKAKTRQFKDLILSGLPTNFTYATIVESAIDFVVSGPVLSAFRRWEDTINSAFPSRHVVSHGRADVGLFTEENSVKLFLLVDSIIDIIRRRSDLQSHDADCHQ